MDVGRSILEVFFPRWCCGCNTHGELLCPRCLARLTFSDVTDITGPYVASISAVVDLDPISRSLIHQLKYQSVKELSLVCARLMFLYGTIPPVDALTSIPLHTKRYSERGFNQAEEIGLELSRLLNIPYLRLLKRIKHTTNLARITDHEKRKQLIVNQFAIEPRYINYLKNTEILLIDDVWTTGATLNEAAKVLNYYKAKTVHGFTFAHEV